MGTPPTVVHEDPPYTVSHIDNAQLAWPMFLWLGRGLSTASVRWRGWMLPSLDLALKNTSPLPEKACSLAYTCFLPPLLGPRNVIIVKFCGCALRQRLSLRPDPDNVGVSIRWGVSPDLKLSAIQVGVPPTSIREGIYVWAKTKAIRLLALVPRRLRWVFRLALERVLGPRLELAEVDGATVTGLLEIRRELSAEEFASSGFARALERGGRIQGRRDRSRCFNRVIEVFFTDGSHELCGVVPCKSWRCWRCRRRLTRQWVEAVHGQVMRDVARGEDWYVFATLTFDPADWRSHGEAAVLGTSGDRGPWRRFLRFLRSHYADVELVRVLEWTRRGTGVPHLHLLIRSKALVEELVEDAGCASLAELRVATAAWDETHPGARRYGSDSITPHVQRRLARGARDAGYGVNFYSAAVHAIGGIAGELLKLGQISNSMPVGVRRVQATVGRADGTGFFTVGGVPLLGEVEDEDPILPGGEVRASDLAAYEEEHGTLVPALPPGVIERPMPPTPPDPAREELTRIIHVGRIPEQLRNRVEYLPTTPEWAIASTAVLREDPDSPNLGYSPDGPAPERLVHEVTAATEAPTHRTGPDALVEDVAGLVLAFEFLGAVVDRQAVGGRLAENLRTSEQSTLFLTSREEE